MVLIRPFKEVHLVLYKLKEKPTLIEGNLERMAATTINNPFIVSRDALLWNKFFKAR